MTKLLLALTAIACASPAMAQTYTITPYGSSIYGGPPQGYTMHYQNNSGDLADIGRRELQRYQPHQTTCTTIGYQTICN